MGGLLWLVGLVLASGVAALGVRTAGSASDVRWGTVTAGAALALGLTVGWGALLGAAARWRDLACSVAAATAVLIALYVGAMLFWPRGDDVSSDDAAGAGVVLLIVPMAVSVALCLGLGAVPAALVRRGLQRGRARRAA
ncbi:hypothetical protein EV189_0920 [Motilibacter rhizosphaerae]|uniref:Uncharacterized protein n=1 Tax=Motilibacter rhizosphaerae TaxID=598652 RepID=A0A4Q7NWI6_9ACTN|nr:hypothetical protein [Motilibacter rhizosphaerae]RZS91673.1 hypothetical protein EV189_0920 [Motilibacter rhizosphaerae]